VASAAKPARRIPWMLLAIITVLAVLALAASYWFFVGRLVETTDDAYVGGDVTVMSPKVNGFVTDVLVHDNQFVHANQVLIRLDARDYDARLAQASAEVESAQAAVVELQAKKSLQLATINEQAAEVRASGAELTRSAADQTRYRELVKDDAVSNQVVERADADLTKAHAAVDRSSAALIAAQRQIAVLDAQIGDAEARIATAGGATGRGIECGVHHDPLADRRLRRQSHRACRLAGERRRVAADRSAVERTVDRRQLQGRPVEEDARWRWCRRRSGCVEQTDSRRG
jgi:Multidrug resistance efflux pump